MAHRCEFCEMKDCNGRCSRTVLKKIVKRLRHVIASLEMGERAMEQELDRLVAAKREADEQMYSSGMISGDNQPA